MLATLTSFLPSSISAVAEKSIPVSPVPTTPSESSHPTAEPQIEMVVDEHGVKKKDKSKESFIFVRPPPSKTNHPLNLQVQLVPPHSKEQNRSTTTRRSPDDNTQVAESPNAENLYRTSSMRSDASHSSNYSTSQSSFASVNSTSSGRRMIIPLYNLQAHNVMTNIIVDAGTDAKIAKFQKRGLEIIGLAVLEPMEVWGHGRSSGLASAKNDNDGHAHLPQPNTPDSSFISLSSTNHIPPPVSVMPVIGSTLAPQTPHTPTRKFFGKLFKKKDEAQLFDNNQQSSPRKNAHFVERALESPKIKVVEPQSAHPSSTPTSVILQSAVLGIQPILNSPTYPPRGRPGAYVWTVVRWLKGSQATLLGGVKGVFGNDRREDVSDLQTLVEVRFEWTRGKGGDKKRRRSRIVTDGTDPTPGSLRNSVNLTPSNTSSETADARQTRRKRSSMLGGRRSMDSQGGGSIQTSTTTSSGGHNGEESDPEDSETPWTCNMVVQRIAYPVVRPRNQRRSSTASASFDAPETPSGPQYLKIKVATVRPTPHHPKVVSMLTIPFPLPDIELEQVRLRKRVITAAGVARPVSISGLPLNIRSPGLSMFGNTKESLKYVDEGLILTAEDIKDVVATTGLWLVVREAMGGVGKISRKGDGWKLRG